MTLQLLNAVQQNTLKVAELRKYSRDALVARIETSFGATTLLHNIMLIGNERLVSAALEIIGSDKPAMYTVLDADNNTPVHAFAQRVVSGQHNDQLTAAVINSAPLAALRATNKNGDTPAHLFPLCGNTRAVEMCRKRDPSLVVTQNALRQTPVELALERQRVEQTSELKVLQAENRRLAHNQSMADAEEAKLAEFYRRMDIETKRRDAQEAALRQEVERSAERIRALEAIAQTKERVMREAIANREKAEAQVTRLKQRLDEAAATQSSAADAVERTARTLAERERELLERQTALAEAFAEVTALRTETTDALADDQRSKIDAAEQRAAALQAQIAAEQAARDAVAQELGAQQTLVTRLQSELDEARRRVTEVETTKTRADADESAARSKFEELRAQLCRVQTEERLAFETQIATLRAQNEQNRNELARLQLSGDEAKKLRETLEAERDRTEQWQHAHEESELRVRSLLVELEAEQARPIAMGAASATSNSSTGHAALQRRPSSTKMSAAVSAALSTSTTIPAPTPVNLATFDEGANDKFIQNVINRVLECDCDALSLLVKLELDIAGIVDRAGTGLLELFMMKVLQASYVTTAANWTESTTSQAVIRASEMFELLVRAGARWAGLPKFIAEHSNKLGRGLAAKFEVYEQWWAFADALLAGDKVKNAHVALQRALPTIGDPNHILTQFHSKAHRETFAGREMSYLHLALELYNEQVLVVVELLLSVPGIDVNLANAHQLTPLHAAIQRFYKVPGRCASLVEALMAAGADPLRPCDNVEVIEHWASLAADAVPKHATNEFDKEARQEALATVSRARSMQRTSSRASRSTIVVGAQRDQAKLNNDELTWLATTTNKYTTPLAMAGIIGSERLTELLTQERYRRVETRTLAAMIIERAMLHHWLLEAFESGALARYPALAKYFEFLHHVPHCFNPYTTSVIVATNVRPRALKTKLAVGLAQSIVDVVERHIVEHIVRRLDDPQSIESKSLAAASNGSQPPQTPRGSSGGSRFGSVPDAHQALEQLTADLEGNNELLAIWQLASSLLRIVKASESHAYDVGPTILASIVERYDEAVEEAIALMIERRAETPPAAFVYVVARDDAQFGPRVCYDSILPSLQQSVLQALVANGDIEKLEALHARASEALEHRLASDRALLKLAIDSRQPLVVAWFDYVAERSAMRLRRAFEARASSASVVALATAQQAQRQGVKRDAKECKAANREHYSLVTLEGSTILHLCVTAMRDDLLDFVLSTAFGQLSKCDAHGRRPVELAVHLASNDRLTPAQKQALASCTALLRGTAHTLVTPLVFPPMSTNAPSPRKSPVATIVSPRAENLVSPRSKERTTPRSDSASTTDPDGAEQWSSLPLDELKSPRTGADAAATTTDTPRHRHRHRHRSSCTNKDK